MDELVLELDAAYADNSIDSGDQAGPSQELTYVDIDSFLESLYLPDADRYEDTAHQPWDCPVFCVPRCAFCTSAGPNLAPRCEQRPGVRVFKGERARL